MKLKITKSTVDNISDAAISADKRHYVFDTELQGFGLSATKNGAVSYFIEYRMPDKRRLTFGKHGPLTPHEARIQAKALLGDVAKGIDVARRPKTKQTFEQAFESYMQNNGRDNRSWEATRRLIKFDVVPALGKKTSMRLAGVTSLDS